MKSARDILFAKAAEKGQPILAGTIPMLVEAMEEYRSQSIQVCPDCEGDMEIMSTCCGASIDRDILICKDNNSGS